MTPFGSSLVESIETGGILSAAALLRSAIPLNPLGTLAEVRQKEALLRSHSVADRSVLAAAYVDGVIASEVSLLPSALNYVAYCRLVANLRDRLAARAHNEAELLARIPIHRAIELCMIAISALARERLRQAQAEPPRRELPAEPDITVPAKLIDVIWDISRIHSLLPLMLQEVVLSRKKVADRSARSAIDALRAAQRLSLIASDWQSLTYVRQSVAWSEETVSRVGPGDRVLLDPARAEAEHRKLANRRRLGLVAAGFKPGQTDDIRHFLMPLIAPLAAAACQAVGRPNDSDEAAEAFLRDLGSSMVASDVVIFDFLAAEGVLAGTVRVLLCAYFFVSLLCRQRRDGFFRSRLTYLPRWPERSLHELISTTSGVDTARVREVMTSCSWNPASPNALRQPLDLGATPYIHLDDEQVGIALLPGASPRALAETRRALVSSKKLSAVVGNTYEKYVRAMLRQAGFSVPDGSVKLRKGKKTITDVDALGFKDDCVIVVQAKHFVEPGSHHAFWKAEQEVMCGVRQCAAAMRHFEEDPSRIHQHFPEAKGAAHLNMFGLIVTPSLRFAGASFGSISVIDDSYLGYVVYVGKIRGFNLTPEGFQITRSGPPMYEGNEPTGPEFISLMKTPEFFRHFGLEDWRLESVVRKVCNIEFLHLNARDAMSHTDHGLVESAESASTEGSRA